MTNQPKFWTVKRKAAVSVAAMLTIFATSITSTKVIFPAIAGLMAFPAMVEHNSEFAKIHQPVYREIDSLKACGYDNKRQINNLTYFVMAQYSDKQIDSLSRRAVALRHRDSVRMGIMP